MEQKKTKRTKSRRLKSRLIRGEGVEVVVSCRDSKGRPTQFAVQKDYESPKTHMEFERREDMVSPQWAGAPGDTTRCLREIVKLPWRVAAETDGGVSCFFCREEQFTAAEKHAPECVLVKARGLVLDAEERKVFEK